MMHHRVGIIMLVHEALERAALVARHWIEAGCPVVIHVDQNVPKMQYEHFVHSLSDLPEVSFCRRYRCEWGTWGLVAATQEAGTLILESYPDVAHVLLSSGACLPLRPITELQSYLRARPDTDFIESVTIADVVWTIGGLDKERFTMRFPFSWKKHRHLFDRYVELQRRVGFKRKIPPGLSPHIGSQWWCLSRATFHKILTDPERPKIDRYFKYVWIPDESYFQTMARRHSKRIESKSLTLSKFDHQGKPHVFYDDHLQLLRKSDCFITRKIWPGANRLYNAFLGIAQEPLRMVEPNPGKIDRIFAQAVERRLRGRDGLYMQSRFPSKWSQGKMTPKPYFIFQGFDGLFLNFHAWLRDAGNLHVHGHIFDRKKIMFETGEDHYQGCLLNNHHLRDYNPSSFLKNLLWAARESTHCFHFGPWDRQQITPFLARDEHAHFMIISGAWLIPLFKSGLSEKRIRQLAAVLQKIERKQLGLLRERHSKAHLQLWSLAEFLESPYDALSLVLSSLASQVQIKAINPPIMQDLHGFEESLQMLKNLGMHPHLAGSFPLSTPLSTLRPRAKMPYIIR